MRLGSAAGPRNRPSRLKGATIRTRCDACDELREHTIVQPPWQGGRRCKLTLRCTVCSAERTMKREAR